LTRSVPEELLKVKKIKEEPKWEDITSFMKEVSEGTQNKDKKALKNYYFADLCSHATCSISNDPNRLNIMNVNILYLLQFLTTI
jgi:hypothetical protein